MKILCLSDGCGGGGGGGPISQLSPERQILTDNTVKLGHSLDRRWGGGGGGGGRNAKSQDWNRRVDFNCVDQIDHRLDIPGLPDKPVNLNHSPFLTGRTVSSSNILRTVQRTILRFLTEVRRTFSSPNMVRTVGRTILRFLTGS